MPGKANGGVARFDEDAHPTASESWCPTSRRRRILTGQLLDATAATMKAISAINETLVRANTALSDIEQTSRNVADSYRLRMQAGGEMAEQEARRGGTCSSKGGDVKERRRTEIRVGAEPRYGSEVMAGLAI